MNCRTRAYLYHRVYFTAAREEIAFSTRGNIASRCFEICVLLRENWSLGSSGWYIRRELSRTEFAPGQLCTNTRSRAPLLTLTLSCRSETGRLKRTGIRSRIQIIRTCSHNEMCAYTPREIYR